MKETGAEPESQESSFSVGLLPTHTRTHTDVVVGAGLND